MVCYPTERTWAETKAVSQKILWRIFACREIGNQGGPLEEDIAYMRNMLNVYKILIPNSIAKVPLGRYSITDRVNGI